MTRQQPEVCLAGDVLDVDDLLLGPASGPALNPREKSTFVVPWPSKTSTSRQPDGTTKVYERYPSGLAVRTSIEGIPVRIKIYVDIGMIAVDRDIKTSCLWRTKFCSRHCYNRALFRVRPNLKKSGDPDEVFWDILDGDVLHEILHSDAFKDFSQRMGKTPKFMRGRMRLATRGEAFSEPNDVLKVDDMMSKNPQTVFWVTTRSWVDDEMAEMIEATVMRNENARVLASLDPSHTAQQYERIMGMGWNTIFFGDDTFTEGRFLCPKTWQKKLSYCRICQKGCFSKKPVDVHLKLHGTKVTEAELQEFRGRG